MCKCRLTSQFPTTAADSRLFLSILFSTHDTVPLCSRADVPQSFPSLPIADVFASHIADRCVLFFLSFLFGAEVHLLFIARNRVINLDSDIKRLKVFECVLLAVYDVIFGLCSLRIPAPVSPRLSLLMLYPYHSLQPTVTLFSRGLNIEFTSA